MKKACIIFRLVSFIYFIRASVFYCISAEDNLFLCVLEQNNKIASSSIYLMLIYLVLGFYG